MLIPLSRNSNIASVLHEPTRHHFRLGVISKLGLNRHTRGGVERILYAARALAVGRGTYENQYVRL